jgi:hypothetical protein
MPHCIQNIPQQVQRWMHELHERVEWQHLQIKLIMNPAQFF